MSYSYLKYSLVFVVIILIATISSCTKGDEPVPITSEVTTQDANFMREGVGDDNGDGGVSIIGGGANEDEDDSIIGGDDNEDDDDVDVVGSDIVIGGIGGSVGSAGGRGGN